MKKVQYYDLILALFIAVLLISNISATKLTMIGPFLMDGGALLFPLAYLLGGVLTEVYGYKYARRAIWTGFVIMVIAVGVFTAVRYLPAAPEYTDQAAFESVLGFLPRIVAASLVAYLVGVFVNSYLIVKIKVATKGKSLWLRLVASTVVGQLLDTTIFALIAFGGVLSGQDMIAFIAIGWVFKSLVEVLLLPVTYRIVAFLKAHERIATHDAKTDFNPFSLSLR